MRKKIIDYSNLLDFANLEENLSAKGFDAVCGVDECGRGPLAGPVVAAALIWPCGIRADC